MVKTEVQGLKALWGKGRVAKWLRECGRTSATDRGADLG